MGEQKERMLVGELYLAEDPELAEERQRCRLLLARYNASSAADDAERRTLLAELLGGLGDGTRIEPPLHCDYGYNLKVGARCYLNFGLVALDCAPITIGDDVQIGPGVQLLAASHPLDPDQRRAGLEFAKPVSVLDGAWLGGGVIVCPGVTIGEDSVVGAGSVVTRDVPPLSVAVGNPCRVIRQL